MLKYPEIDPVALAFGTYNLPWLGEVAPKIHWYGLMYLGGFAFGWWLAKLRVKRSYSPINAEQVDDLIFYGALGVVIGGRLGYSLFYHFDKLIVDPSWLLRAWEGGMSFHGGLIGVIVATWLFARKVKRSVWDILDFGAPLVPIGLGLGRIGNFIGQELWGSPSDLPWAMVFPNDPSSLARHPSQLYEFLLEGVVLFVLLFWFSSKQRPKYAVGGLFLLLYGTFRFLVEFVRIPDDHLGYDAFDWLTRGQILSLPMIVTGIVVVVYAYRQQSVLLGSSQKGKSS